MSISCQYSSNIFDLSQNMTNCSASAHFLQSIFGQPIDVLTGTAKMSAPVVSLMTLFLGHFNTLGLSLILALFSYVVFHGFLSTVNEGKFGGRDMGHWSYALRAILPGAMLVPVKGGFCAMQFTVMYFILVGVNLANYVWQQSIGDIKTGYTPTTPTAIKSAIAKDLSQDFVIQTVGAIADDHNFDGQGLNLANVSIWNSPYANTIESQATSVCNQLKTGYVNICLSALKQMQQNNLQTIYFPMGGYRQGNDSSTTLPLVTLSFDKLRLNTGGQYKIQQLPSAQSPLMQTATSGLSGAVNYARTGTAGTTSFNGAILGVENQLINSNMHLTTGQKMSDMTVIGTGETCQATCRFSGTSSSNAPVPGITTQKECGANSDYTWTTQCYRASSNKVTEDFNDQPISVPQYDEVAAKQIGDSWWYGSDVYLQLTNKMAENINALAKEVNTLVIPTNSLLSYTPAPTNFTIHMGVDQGYKLFESNGQTRGDQAYGIDLQGGNPVIKAPITFGGSSSVTANNKALSSIPWDKLIAWYGPSHQKGETAAEFLQKVMGINPRTAVTISDNSPDLVMEPTAFPTWLYNDLKSMPLAYQNPIKLIIFMNLSQTTGNEIPMTPTEFQNYIKRIVTVLQDNHVYPGSATPGQVGVATAGEVLPAQTWINKVFNHLMGQNMPFAGTGANPSIFSKIYSLGNTDVSSLSDVMSNSFNTVANAQRIGLEMIQVVTSSLTDTYANLDSQLKSDGSNDAYWSIGAIGGIATTGAIPIVGGGLATAAATAVQTALQFRTAQQMFSIGQELSWMPIAMLVLTSMLTAGISFAVILPMTPFFLFWAGEMAWILAVVEAMVAAPLLTLGFTTPGGHQHFGHTVPGLKMLLAVVFRPVLMVLGLLAGMVLTFVVIRFSSEGFQLVSQQILNFSGSNTTSTIGTYTGTASGNVPLSQGIVACLLLFTFCSFMMMAFTKCFSMIYVIPEKVMQWIGGMADKAGQQELEKLSGGMTQQAQQGGQAGGQSTEKAVGAAQSHKQADMQAEGTALQGGASLGGAANKGVNAAAGAPKGGANGVNT